MTASALFARLGVALLVCAFTVCVAGAQGNPSAAPDTSAPLVTRDPATLSFPNHYWTAEIRANLSILEIFRSDWDKRLKLDAPPSGQATIDEIRHLHSLMALRDERREEIKLQADQPFIPYFFPTVMMHQWSHPRTHELMNVAYGLGPLVVPFKDRFKRARPSQLSPTLAPMILVPGHPAYPSGHGFQSWLIALMTAEVRPDARSALFAMAQRIGMNREIAGVHYPSDTKAGQILAEQVFEIAKQGKQFQELLIQAKAEWR